MATYGIVFGTNSKMIRRVIADDDGVVTIGKMPDGITPAVICSHQLSGLPTTYHPIGPGESAIQQIPPSAIRPAGPTDWARAVKNATGVDPPILSCALVNPGNVVEQVIIADPDVDAAPGGFTMVLCYSPAIHPGCTYDPASGLFSFPAGVLPPHSPGNSTGSPVQVPPSVIPKP